MVALALPGKPEEERFEDDDLLLETTAIRSPPSLFWEPDTQGSSKTGEGSCSVISSIPRNASAVYSLSCAVFPLVLQS